MWLSIKAEDESRRSFGSSLRPHLNVGAMSHNCRTADHLLGLKTVLALGFRPRTSAAELRFGVDYRPLQLDRKIWSRNERSISALKLKPDRPLTV